MISRIKLSLLFLLCIHFTYGKAFTQDFKLGFRLESNAVKVNQEAKSLPLFASIFGLQANASVTLSEVLSLKARTAINFGPDYYSGTELGLLLEHYFSNPFYLTAGIIRHKNNQLANTTDAPLPWYSNEADMIMPALGIGVSLPAGKKKNGSGKYDIELMYINAFNIEIGTGSYIPDDGLPHPAVIVMKPIKLAYVLKLSIGVSFGL